MFGWRDRVENIGKVDVLGRGRLGRSPPEAMGRPEPGGMGQGQPLPGSAASTHRNRHSACCASPAQHRSIWLLVHSRIIASMEATTQPRPQRAALALFDGRGYVGSRNRVESARRHGSQTVRLRVSEGSLSPRPTQSAQASASSGLIEPACGTSRSNPTSAGTQRTSRPKQRGLRESYKHDVNSV